SCNGIAGVNGKFTVTRGNGKANGQSVVTVPTGPTGRAQVSFPLGTAPGNNYVKPDFQDNTTNSATFPTYGVARDPMPTTRFHGLVGDNGSRPVGGAGILILIDNAVVGSGQSDYEGQFVIPNLSAKGQAELLLVPTGISTLGGQNKPLPPGVSF